MKASRFTPFLALATIILGCAPTAPTKLPQFHNHSRQQIIAKLGQPLHDNIFPMSAAAGEFRIELQNTYPLSNPANANIQIEEMTWRDGDYWITLWLHQPGGKWVVLDSCRWHKNIEF